VASVQVHDHPGTVVARTATTQTTNQQIIRQIHILTLSSSASIHSDINFDQMVSSVESGCVYLKTFLLMRDKNISHQKSLPETAKWQNIKRKSMEEMTGLC